MRLAQQPKYKIILRGNTGESFDVTHNVEGQVVYTEQGDYLNTLEFTLTNAQLYSNLVRIGTKVYFEGGSIDPDNPSNLDNYRAFFTGYVHRVVHAFPKNGLRALNLICYDGIGVKGTRIFGTWKYPGSTSKISEVRVTPSSTLVPFVQVGKPIRSWADKPALKASEIVKGIVEDMNTTNKGFIPIRIGKLSDGSPAVLIDPDREFTKRQPETQKDESDWAFLRRFAAKLNCIVWSEFNDADGAQEIFFVSKEHCTNIENSLSFIYPERKDDESFTTLELEPNQLVMEDITVDEDTEAAMALSRIYTKFQSDRSESLSILEFYNPEDGKMYRYELDEKKVQEFSDSHGLLETLKFPWNESTSFEQILNFYKKVEIPKEVPDKDFATIQRPWIGVKINGKTEGCVRIRGRQYYKINNIGRFSSEGITGRFRSQYYLYVCKHTWDGEAYNCDLQFMR